MKIYKYEFNNSGLFLGTFMGLVGGNILIGIGLGLFLGYVWRGESDQWW